MPNQISQIQVGGVTYNICDTTARNTVENMKTVNNISLLGSGNISVGVTGIKGSAEDSYRTGEVTLTPSNLGIGTIYSAQIDTTSISVANIDTPTAGPSLLLPPGSYIITGVWQFGTPESTGDRVCQTCFTTKSNPTSNDLWTEFRHRIVEGASNYCTVNAVAFRTFTSETRVYLTGSSSKKTTTQTSSFIHAIKIA